MSALIDIWSNEVSKMREQNQSNDHTSSLKSSPNVTESGQQQHPKWSRVFHFKMPASESSFSMIMDILSA
ncbi:unnamed protein product [Amaranthus hypochondriacus]